MYYTILVQKLIAFMQTEGYIWTGMDSRLAEFVVLNQRVNAIKYLREHCYKESYFQPVTRPDMEGIAYDFADHLSKPKQILSLKTAKNLMDVVFDNAILS